MYTDHAIESQRKKTPLALAHLEIFRAAATKKKGVGRVLTAKGRLCGGKLERMGLSTRTEHQLCLAWRWRRLGGDGGWGMMERGVGFYEA